MKNLISKLEEGFNKAFYALLAFLSESYKKYLPKDLQQKIFNFFSPFLKTYRVIHKKFDKSASSLNQGIRRGVSKFKAADLQGKVFYVSSLIEKFFSPKHFKIFFKNNIVAPLKTVSKVFEEKLKNLNQYHLVFFILILALAGMTSLGIYKSTYNIVSKEYTHKDRKVASIGFDNLKSFPDYYGYDQKLSIITQIEIPAYIESIQDFRNLKVDFSIEFTNVTSKRYFDENYYIFMDRLQVTLEPILPSFSLEIEGKTIIREKLLGELNAILINDNIDGRVKNVTITDILAN